MTNKQDLLIVGLGNPGIKYSKTRHNIGFIAVDHILELFDAKWAKSKFDAEIAIVSNKNSRIIFLKPTSFMNLSGIPVQAICSYYKIRTENIVVIHDDIALENGRLKSKIGGSSGGHNGIKSIDANLGNNYWRIRIGVGEASNIDVSNYVLSKPTDEQWEVLRNSIEKISSIFSLLLNRNFAEFKDSVEHIARN